MSAPEVPNVDLSRIDLSSALSADGTPFLEIEVVGDGTVLYGQMLPEQVRAMALDWLTAAEAAEQDALAFGVLTAEVGLDPEDAARTIGLFRQARQIRAGLEVDETPQGPGPDTAGPFAGMTAEQLSAALAQSDALHGIPPDEDAPDPLRVPLAIEDDRARILAEQDDDLG